MIKVDPNGKNPFEITGRRNATGDGPSLLRSSWIFVQKIPKRNVPIPRRKKNDREDLRAIENTSEAKDPVQEIVEVPGTRDHPRNIVDRAARSVTMTKAKMGRLCRMNVKNVRRTLEEDAIEKTATKNLEGSIRDIGCLEKT